MHQQQRGFGFGGSGAAAPSHRGMPMAVGAGAPHLAVQQKEPTLAPPQHQQQNQGSSSARAGMAAAAAEQIAHEDAWKACNPDFTTPFASVEDAISRLLPYHVFAEYEEDEIYVEDQPPVKNKSSVEEWDDDHEAEAIRMAEEFEKQVLTFNVAVRKSAAGAARAEERLMVDNFLLGDEQRQSEHVRAAVRQQQLVALQRQQQKEKEAALQRQLMLEQQQQQAALQQVMMVQRRQQQQQQQMMSALQQQQRQPAIIMPQGHSAGLDVFLDAYADGGPRQQHWHGVQPQQPESSGPAYWPAPPPEKGQAPMAPER